MSAKKKAKVRNTDEPSIHVRIAARLNPEVRVLAARCGLTVYQMLNQLVERGIESVKRGAR